MPRIQYVGKKPMAFDNVAGSRKIWEGHGDVQEVSAEQAKILLKFPDQWALDDPDEAARLADASPEADRAAKKPLEKMSKTELLVLAKAEFGHELPPTLSRKLMIDQIEDWRHTPPVAEGA